MSEPESVIRIDVDVTNPGQFFACCGLLEMADRLWEDAAICGAFDSEIFELSSELRGCTLADIITAFVEAEASQLDANDNAASPIHLGDPFDLRLDWWQKVEGTNKNRVDLGGGDQLGTWAGQQRGPVIFRVMKSACGDIELRSLLDDARAVYDTKGGKAKRKTTSPFYFDARREETSLDIGFSPDSQDMSVKSYPAVEALALVGLQRFRPAVRGNGRNRSFLYTAWADPLPLGIAMAAVSGRLPVRSQRGLADARPQPK